MLITVIIKWCFHLAFHYSILISEEDVKLHLIKCFNLRHFIYIYLLNSERKHSYSIRLFRWLWIGVGPLQAWALFSCVWCWVWTRPSLEGSQHGCGHGGHSHMTEHILSQKINRKWLSTFLLPGKLNICVSTVVVTSGIHPICAALHLLDMW